MVPQLLTEKAMKLAAPFAAAILLLAGCSNNSSPTGPDTARLGTPFRLSPGESSTIEGELLRIRFERVATDSRCPPDVVCGWAGEVTASFRIQIGETSSQTISLSTVTEPRQSVDGYELHFREAFPGPAPSTGKIPPDRYRVELVVTK